MSDPLPRAPITLLVFSASLRAGSLNTQLAELAAVTVEANGGEVDRGSMREFDAPSFDQGVLDRDGFPAGAQEFRSRLERCDAFVIAAPEYNASMPGLLKNAVDWVSRDRPQPFAVGVDPSAEMLERHPQRPHTAVRTDHRR